MDTIRILVVDDQTLIRRGIALMLQMEADLSVVGQAADGAQAVELARQLEPDVILMDLKMPRMDGIAATRAITTMLPHTQVVVLTTYDTDDMVFDAVRAGANAYLLKDADEAEILDVIRGVHRGESWLDPTIARKVMDEFRRSTSHIKRASTHPPDAPPVEDLTERETEILSLITNGKTNLEIAEQIFLTEGTAKNYVSKIMGKLHANDRTQLAVKALRNGLAKLD